MSQPEARYFGEDITCYPGSNQTDEGKLNLEYNMARLVSRLSSKNFCIVKPSFELSIISDAVTGKAKIQVGTGQASINGMDLIMTNVLQIDPPESEGEYYLAFKLARDSGKNVLGDLIEGVTRTFKGVYLTYWTERPNPMDPDMLYLGKVKWDGTSLSDLEEDEDKYGRIWAEDILCKLLDPKHPDFRRLNLQEYLYKLPDWYFSKEGDTVYGPIILADNRDKNNPGIIMNVDDTGSHIKVKDPNTDNDKLLFYGDLNNDGVIDNKDKQILEDFLAGKRSLTPIQKKLADVNHDGTIDNKDLEYILNFINKEGNSGDTGNIYYIQASDKGLSIETTPNKTEVKIEKATIYEDKKDDVLHIHNEGNICIDAEGDLKLEADKSITISTESGISPVLKLDNDKVSITDPSAPNLTFNIEYTDGSTIQQTLGKAIWQYNETTKNVSLLQKDVNNLEVVPNSIFRNNQRVVGTISIGQDDSLPQTQLARTSWWLREAVANGKTNHLTPEAIVLTNPSLAANNNSYISLRNTNDTIHSRLFDDAKLELLNPSREPQIQFKDGTVSRDITLRKVANKKELNIDGDLSIINLVASGSLTGNGLITTNGTITFKRGTNDATIIKDNNSSTLRTSANLYVGTSGTGKLNAGDTVVNGKLGIGGSTYDNSECKVDASGNINTSGTITGSKVYRSCL